MSFSLVSRSDREAAERARSSYNIMSDWYDILAGPWEEEMRNSLLQGMNPGGVERLLEIGCGTGGTLLWLTEIDGPLPVGLDVSEGMLDVARDRLEAAEVKETKLVHGDALTLPFASAVFGAVLMVFTLELFSNENISQALSECKRTLAEDGDLYIVSLGVNGGGPAFTIYGWLHRLFPKFVDCRPIDLPKIVERAGFEVRENKTLEEWGFPVQMVRAGPM